MTASKILKFSVLATIFLTFVSGCARPKIEIDASEVENSNLKGISVGLLEVHRANTGSNFGIALPETQSESVFCTATLLDDGRLLTGTDCLQKDDVAFEAKNMEFHVRRLGAERTESFPVKSILEADHARKTVFLEVSVSAPIVAKANSASIMTGFPTSKEYEQNLPALAVSVSSPDDKGRAKVTVSPTTILTKTPDWMKEKIKKEGEKGDDKAKPEPVKPNESPPQLPVVPGDDAENPTIEKVFSSPHGILLKDLREPTWGTPIFYKGKIVGIVKNAELSEEVESNAQWILKK